MANTLSVMTNVLRNVVSKKRIRYKENGFNLDLAYICDNIIAMGYPADNIESIYRNRIDDVYKFLEENHGDHYKIYNLCLERSYDINKFHGRVAVYPFEDHNPPTIELIQKFCDDVDTWLKADSLNVAAVHCKAGKGRTGTMICCYLLYSKQQSTAEDALACYDEKRTRDRKGVTIPSQRRYVQYFSKLIRSGLPYEKRTLQFCEIRFIDASLLQSQGLVYCFISVLQDTTCAVKVQQLRSFTIDFRHTFSLDIQNPSLSVTGDIKVELTHKTPRKKIFHFWFNTFFVCDSAVIEDEGGRRKLIYTLNKFEIDDAHKDKEHKCFSEDFKVQLVFSMEEPDGKGQTSVSNQIGNHKTSQTARLTQNNFAALPQNSRSSSEINYICDQKSSSIASVNSLDLLGGRGENSMNFIINMDQANNYMSSSNNSSSNNVQQSASGIMNTTLSHNSMEDEEMGTPLSSPPSYAHFNGIDANHHQSYVNMNSSYLTQQQQQQELYAKVVKPIVNATSTPNQKIVQKPVSAPAQQLNNQQPMQFMHQQQLYQPSASNIPRVNNNRDSKDTNSKHQMQFPQQQQQQQQHQEQEYELKSTTPDKSKSFTTRLGNRCAAASPFGLHAAVPNTQSNVYATSPPATSNNHVNLNSKGKSNSVSSSSDSTSTTSSASSSPSSNASGDNEEDWESVNSIHAAIASSSQISTTTTTTTTKTSTIITQTSAVLTSANTPTIVKRQIDPTTTLSNQLIITRKSNIKNNHAMLSGAITTNSAKHKKSLKNGINGKQSEKQQQHAKNGSIAARANVNKSSGIAIATATTQNNINNLNTPKNAIHSSHLPPVKKEQNGVDYYDNNSATSAINNSIANENVLILRQQQSNQTSYSAAHGAKLVIGKNFKPRPRRETT